MGAQATAPNAQSASTGAQSVEDVLFERFNTQGETGGPGGYKWYEPTEAIAGAHDGFFEVVPVELRTISEDALAAARDYWMTEMLAPSPNNEHFGLMIWLGKPHAERRLYHRPDSWLNEVPRPGVYNSEPFLADDLFLFDGSEGRSVAIVPSEQLVIVRTGFRPHPGQPEWDNAFLPNTIIRGIRPAVSATAP